MQLLCHLYVQRWGDLWLGDRHSAWFSECIKSLSFSDPALTGTREDRSTVLTATTVHTSIYRHVIVLERTCRSLFSFIPKEILNTRQLSCDPLLPYLRVSEYNAEFFQGVEDVLGYRPRRPNSREEERFLERLVPDGVFRRQLQVCMPRLSVPKPKDFVGFFRGTPELCSAISWRHCSVCTASGTVARGCTGGPDDRRGKRH